MDTVGPFRIMSSGLLCSFLSIAIKFLDPKLGPGGISKCRELPTFNELPHFFRTLPEMGSCFFNAEEFSSHFCSVAAVAFCRHAPLTMGGFAASSSHAFSGGQPGDERCCPTLKKGSARPTVHPFNRFDSRICRIIPGAGTDNPIVADAITGGYPSIGRQNRGRARSTPPPLSGGMDLRSARFPRSEACFSKQLDGDQSH